MKSREELTCHRSIKEHKDSTGLKGSLEDESVANEKWGRHVNDMRVVMQWWKGRNKVRKKVKMGKQEERRSRYVL